MPAPVEIVSAPAVVRNLEGDEQFVLDQFEQHANHCTQCSSAIEALHDTLCERGHAYAVDVTNYLYSQGGKYFAAVDRENGKLRRVKLPREVRSVPHLLEGVESGLLLKSSRRGRTRGAVRPPSSGSLDAPRESYDSSYEIRPRRSNREATVEQVRPRSFSPEAEPASPTIITRKPRSSSNSTNNSTNNSGYRVVVHQSPRSSPSRSPASRGSLYGSDQLDRVERRYESTYIKRRSDYRR
ncbi:hypothetical protein N7532_008482 [Penicillium argentinense]|uniref:Uncharacterized protein n=1 Tax=Penicillium argentinense TaxID=1131581 RepID=A0A9W9EXE9_9EURO|nr:uncharacterized protein N7532_008482 [Penicillium argentinense]KAJ5089798.1 hypothetical protein N7532_008482 [Penicillium argentinense]